jgi:hypothetical protein
MKKEHYHHRQNHLLYRHHPSHRLVQFWVRHQLWFCMCVFAAVKFVVLMECTWVVVVWKVDLLMIGNNLNNN